MIQRERERERGLVYVLGDLLAAESVQLRCAGTHNVVRRRDVLAALPSEEGRLMSVSYGGKGGKGLKKRK